MLNRPNCILNLGIPFILDGFSQSESLTSRLLGVRVWKIGVWCVWVEDEGVEQGGLRAQVCALGGALALVVEEG